MPRGKGLLGLEYLGALPVADVGREPLDPRRYDRESSEVRRVSIARDDLRRHRLGTQSERAESLALNLRRQVRVCADRAGHLSDGDLFASDLQTFATARELRVMTSEREPEGDRLGVNPVRAPDHRRVRVLPSARGERGEQSIDARQHCIDGLPQLDRE